MISAGAVLVCALVALGRTEQSFPPIQFVERAPAGTPEGTEGFVVSGRGIINLVTSSQVFRAAQADGCQNDYVIKKLASILVHEEWHVLHGDDEEAAYLAQLKTLVMLDLGPSTGLYRSVQSAMRAAARGGKAAAIPRFPLGGYRTPPSGVRASRTDR